MKNTVADGPGPAEPDGPDHPPDDLVPGQGRPGARVGLDSSCRTYEPAEKVSVQSEVLTFDPRRNWDVGGTGLVPARRVRRR